MHFDDAVSRTNVTKLLSVASAIAVPLILFFALSVSARAQTLTLLYGFPDRGQCFRNPTPNGGLILDAQGNLYGTTQCSGKHNQGSIFELTPSGAETTLFNFYHPVGRYPMAGLVRDSSGNLYGTTYNGGLKGEGVVFELTPTGTEAVLHSFVAPSTTRGKKPPDGGGPEASLTLDGQGNLYGTTSYGGNGNAPVCGPESGCGTVFELTPSGTETLLYQFTGESDGAVPVAPVVFDSQGNLYGTTQYGGTPGFGVVFKLNPSGVETVLYSFTGGADGSFPNGGLVLDKKGNVYGVTLEGGGTKNLDCQAGCGIVFKVSPTGEETILHSFTDAPDGSYPVGSLVFDSHGNLYGATTSGGVVGGGTIFKITASGKETVLYSFTGKADGGGPTGSLAIDSQGNLYGTTSYGGIESVQGGVAFKLTP